ncbi:MAG TPA: ankyrin repeat domain-containing protein [Candidatus Angelobacter sp.]|nr:ankyrin repeat domain-containing protein [Candidatus Angelobacter sp.]
MSGADELIKFWPSVKPEVLKWKFIPFEEDGKAVTAEIEEYVELVPPERFPTKHVRPPLLRPDSKVVIVLGRSGCYGTCPAYTVGVSTHGITFDGHEFVVASGKHTDSVNPDAVYALAKRFIAADFYSMDSIYHAGVTDNPTYVLYIEIDGRKKEVMDYVGSWVGMPAVITELEDAVDSFAHTERWIEGAEGLVAALKLEDYNFQSFEAQILFKEALTRGQSTTVREFLDAGLPLKPLPPPGPYEPGTAPPFQNVGWLTAASTHPETLQILLDHGVSKNDQNDKDLALAGVARSGNLETLRALIAYGANPNADLSKLTIKRNSGAFIVEEQGAGSILIYAAKSGNPDVVREILRYHPSLEARDREGKTAMFAVGDNVIFDKEGARVQCVRLLVAAGANVNARDNDGNTPLHNLFIADVEEELLKLGADVNARNKRGETPIFTTVNYKDGLRLFIEHGADLTIRNNEGKTIFEIREKDPAFKTALQKAMHSSTSKR